MKLRRCFVLIAGVLAAPGCVAPDAATSEPEHEVAQVVQPPLAVTDRTACASDPRVAVGVVDIDTCVGADLFFRAPFGGNGRTCATCHPVGKYPPDRHHLAGMTRRMRQRPSDAKRAT